MTEQELKNKYDWDDIQRIKEDLIAVEQVVEDLNTGSRIDEALEMTNYIYHKLKVMKHEGELK